MVVRRWATLGVLLGLSMALVLAGCGGGPTTARVATQPPAPTATVAAPPPTATAGQSISSGPGTPRPCAAGAGDVIAGDLAITPPTVLYGFNADYMLPDSIPTDKPLALTLDHNNAYTARGETLEAGPVIQGSFLITVCNTSPTRAHTLTSFGVMLDTLTSYSGSLNAINACAFLYSRPTGVGGECDSGYSPDIQQAYQLPGAGTPGAAVTDAAAGTPTLPPGYGLDVDFDISSPSSPAIATYGLGIGVDGAAVVYPAGLRTPPRLDTTIARRWAGDYCNTPQMQALIPATPPANTYYACPH